MNEQQPKGSLLRAVAGTAVAQGVRKGVVTVSGAIVSAIGWPVILTIIAAIIIVALVLIVGFIVALSRMGDERTNLDYQCQSRLGYSVGNTASLAFIPRLATPVSVDPTPTTTWETTPLQPATTTPPTTTPTTTSTPPPTTTTTATTGQANPYATQTVPASADAKTAACASALRTGELIGPPLHDAGTTTGQRAATLANEQVGLLSTDADGTLTGPTNNAFSPANLVRYAYYQASGGEVTLPPTIADQITVGDRVDATAIAPGDLVFFDFTPRGGPTAVMMAITPTLGIDAATVNQPIAVAVLPTGNVIVKRPRTEAPTP
jgi:cell wall-associated NlpC family hydrolase